MKGMAKKVFLLGVGAVSLTKIQVKKQIKTLVKKGAVSTKDSREMLKKIVAATNNERRRIQEFSKAEAKRVQAKLSKTYKPQINGLKKKISLLEKKLKAAGKKTAKKALRKAYKRV